MTEGDVRRMNDRLHSAAKALASHVDSINGEKFTRQIIAYALVKSAIGATGTGRPHNGAAGSGTTITEGPGYEDDNGCPDMQEAACAGPLEERLEQCLSPAEAGDPPSARRAAELFELAGDKNQAADWWRRAAALGDLDAIDYVEGILEDPSAKEDCPLKEGKEARFSA